MSSKFVTGSQELGDGSLRFNTQISMWEKDERGAAPYPASPSASRGKVQRKRTPVTYGRSGFGSSESAALTSLLANKCQELLAGAGSMEYAQTWKRRVTPSGRLYWEHTVSGVRIGDSGSTGALSATGWPTPNTPSGGRSMSPDKMDATGRTADGRKHTASLEHAVKFWPTPNAHDGRRPGPDVHSTQGGNLSRDALLALGITPSSSSAPTGNTGGSALNPAMSRWLQGFPAAWDRAAPGWSEWALWQQRLTAPSA